MCYNLSGDIMRLKNVPYAKEKLQTSNYIISDPKLYKGKFKSLFNNDNPIHIEIGMGKGDFIIENALKYPNINFIGIEKYDSVLVRAVEKLENIELSNLLLIRMDATEISEVFDKEITTIYLNFSDPWPKNRHEDRRLTSPMFLKRYDSIFKKQAHIIQKTDNQDLFAYSIKSFNNYGYKINEIIFNLHKTDKAKENIKTEYEKKFILKGMPIYYIDVEK